MKESKRELYLDIADKYEKYITLGVLSSGERLPSVRDAARKENVNPNTLARAYAVLEEKGLITTVPKKGVYVLPKGTDTEPDNGEDELREIITILKNKGVSVDSIISITREVYGSDDKH